MFQSFFMGGFECAYHKTKINRVDSLADTKHEFYCEMDYQLLKEQNISTVREGFSWQQIDKGYGIYDFSRYERLLNIAVEQNIQQIWDLNHFDYPEDVDPFSDDFVIRFANYAKKVVLYLRKYFSNTLFIVPFNEISFFSWISGEVGEWAPFEKNMGFNLKIQCVKAVISAINAIRSIDNNVRFIHSDPIMYRISKKPFSKLKTEYLHFFEETCFQTWDMISGRIYPELGGSPSHLDILGLNYYIQNQEYVCSVKKDKITNSYYPVCETIPIRSKNRIDFYYLYKKVYLRYRKFMMITETGCYGDLRFYWWTTILNDIRKIITSNIPLLGVCAYPIIDRPDWTTGILTNSGLWDFYPDDSLLTRTPHEESLKLIKLFQQKHLVNMPIGVFPSTIK